MLWDGTFLPEENGVDHAAHAGDLSFEAVVEGGGESQEEASCCCVVEWILVCQNHRENFIKRIKNQG